MSKDYLILIVTIALTIFNIWSWRGKSRAARWWTRGVFGGNRFKIVTVVMPSLLLITFSGVLVKITGYEEFYYLIIVALAVLVIGLIAVEGRDFSWSIGRLWGPRWYVSLSKQEIEDMLVGGNPEEMAHTKAPRWARTYRGAWRCGQYQNHLLPAGERKMTMGFLLVYDEGLWFHPLEGEKTRFPLMECSFDQVVSVKTVPRLCNSRAKKVGYHPRWLWSKLVVRTKQDTYLFALDMVQDKVALRTIKKLRSNWRQRPSPQLLLLQGPGQEPASQEDGPSLIIP